MKAFTRLLLCLSCVLAGTLPHHPALAQSDHAALIERLKAFRFGDDQATLDTVAQWVDESRGEPERRRQAARDLAEVLGSNASFDARQFVCRELVLIAGEEQVPALAGLLQDEALAYYAVMALVRIPGKAVDEALRRELPRSPSRAQLEIMDALGERRDLAAITVLSDQLQSSDAAAREAAAAALGKMGDARAVGPLRQAYQRASGDSRQWYGRALLDCADRLRAAGDSPSPSASASALAVYELLSRNAVTPELSAAALRGTVQARGAKALPLLLDALGKDGSPLQLMAANLFREIPGREVTGHLIERLPRLTATGQLLLIAALSDRGDATAVPAVLALYRSPHAPVRMAALSALGSIGDASTVPLLLQVATAGSREQREAARAGLTRLRGRAVDEKLLAMLNQAQTGRAQTPIRVEIITSLGRRRVIAAVPRLVQETRSGQPAVSMAAVRVLSEMGRPADLPVLLDLLATTSAGRRAVVINAVSEIARRGADEKQRTGAILQRLSRTSAAAHKVELLTVLGQVGGAGALQALREAAQDTAPEVRLSALRRLAEWPSDEPMNDLLRVVRAARDERQRTIALRGYIRMIGLAEQRSPQATLALYRQASSLSKTAETKRLVLSGLAKLPSLAALEYASGFLADNEVRAEAEFAIVEIGRGTAGAWPDKTRVALQPIAGGSAAESARRRAAEVLALIDKFGDFVTAWEVSPAYQREGVECAGLFDMPFPPEEATTEKNVPWRLMPAGSNAEQPWLLDLLALWGGEQRVAYLRTEVWSEAARDVVLELGSDDGVKAWWNGQVVLANNVMRPIAPGQDKVKLQIKAGWNTLLLKVTQNNMGWGACARFTSPDGSAVTGLRCVVPSGVDAIDIQGSKATQ